MDDPSPGARSGPHEIVGPLGTGGMGQVYRVRDSLAAKSIKLSTENFSERFEREAEERCSSLRGGSGACESGREAA